MVSATLTKPSTPTSTSTAPFVLAATSVIGTKVQNPEGEDLGKLEEIMIDVDYGTVAYAVLSFGGFLGLGNKLFAVPWRALRQSREDGTLILKADREMLENAPGFDKDNWPQVSDRSWGGSVYRHYKIEPYWK